MHISDKIANTLFLSLFIVSFAQAKRSGKLEDITCTPSDFEYGFTECDSEQGRWRVAVPTPGCEGINPPIPPKRLDECYKSCDAGQFLNLTSMECQNCYPGTYSLGGGLRFDVWDPLPSGFKVEVEKFHSIFTTVGRQNSKVNCSKCGWRSRGDVLVSQGGPCVTSSGSKGWFGSGQTVDRGDPGSPVCVATLTYSAELVKPGILRFTYQNSDDSVLFQFQASGDKCDGSEGSQWPPLTGDGVWRTEEITLRSGLNIFQWKTMGTEVDTHRQKPVLIKRIEIEGVGYTSACNGCPPGTFSNKSAATSCELCPKDTYSSHKSTDCTPCKEGYYSEPGSACKPRPYCTPADIYERHEACDSNNQTRIIYDWVEPNICIGNLPAPVTQKYCSPCNPGTTNQDGKCRPCPHNHFSNAANDGCQKCPDLTVADNSHILTEWYTIPDGVKFLCISPEDKGCNNSPAWELNGGSVQSGKGHADFVYLVLTLTVGGFRSLGGIVNGELMEVGRLTFAFEMKCASMDCELLLMKETNNTNATVIQRWVGPTNTRTEKIQVFHNSSYTFSWAFQKLGWFTNAEDGDQNGWNEPYNQRTSSRMEESYVRIYSINITNTIDGGASRCVPCQDGLIYAKNGTLNNIGTCVACDPGYYRANISELSNTTGSDISNPKTQCKRCPPATITPFPGVSSNSSGCQPCGPGLISKDGLTCITDCLVKLGQHTYDLRPLKGYHGFRGRSLFTASGNEYFHFYNFSLCTEKAICQKNVSLPHGFGNQTQVPSVEALICQSTIFPPTAGLSFERNAKVPWTGAKALSTHAGSLGDHLIGISHSTTLLGESVARSIAGRKTEDPSQIHFFYSTPDPTPACFKGRSTVLTMQCQLPTTPWSGVLNEQTTSKEFDIKFPEKCPDGQCTGCILHFILATPFACHLCTEDELKIVRGECKNGFQEVHYLSSDSRCLLMYNSSWPTSLKCTTSLPFAVEVAIQLTIALTMVLTVLLICFWRRHRKLEYKYMKLVASGMSNSGGNNPDDSQHRERDLLPVAESCALEQDEAEDDEDEHYFQNDQRHSHAQGQIKEISFYTESTLKNLVSKFSVLNRLKSFNRKTPDNDGSSEIMSLTDKEALT